jgi:hypothetical protein
MVARPLTNGAVILSADLRAIHDVQDFAGTLLSSIAFAVVSAIDFTLFSHVPFTTLARN